MTLAYRVREREVLRGVLAALAVLGIPADRRNTGAMRNASGRLVRFNTTGDADITATIPRGPRAGTRLEIEVKRPGAVPTARQVERLRRTIAAGGIAFWTDSAASAAVILQRLLDGWTLEIDANLVVWMTSPQEKIS